MDTSPDPNPDTTAVLPEALARALLRRHAGDGLEAWLADQRWRAALDGSWVVEAERDGRTYRVEGMPSRGQAVRIVERAAAAGALTSWLIV